MTPLVTMPSDCLTVHCSVSGQATLFRTGQTLVRIAFPGSRCETDRSAGDLGRIHLIVNEPGIRSSPVAIADYGVDPRSSRI
jgi:hypothetical protein